MNAVAFNNFNLGRLLKESIKYSLQDAIVLTLNTTVNTPGASTEIFSDDHETGPNNRVATNNGGVTNRTYTNEAAKAYSGSKFWFAPNTGTPPGERVALAVPVAFAE